MKGLRSRIIPSLLMDEGRLVKTKQFCDPKYVGDPINAVKIFNEKEVDELALFDISAWKGREPNFKLLEKISKEARMPLSYGGGITEVEQAVRIVSLGFEKVSISRAALLRPQLVEEIAARIGSQSTIVTLDVKKNSWLSGWTVYMENGKRKVGDGLEPLLEKFQALGAGEFVLNSIDREGQLDGYDLELAGLLARTVSTPITLLGGAGSTEHMKALERAVGVVGAAAGTLFVFKGVHRAVLISYTKPSRSAADQHSQVTESRP
jgi:cyclase